MGVHRRSPDRGGLIPITADHVVTAVEPYWTESKYVLQDGHPTPTEVRATTHCIDMMMDHAEYECSCGAEFSGWGEAEMHLVEHGGDT